MLTEIMPKNTKKYVCEKCNFECSKKSNYINHTLTLKHCKTPEYLQKNAEKCQPIYKCLCGKIYKFRQSLYTHKKHCIQSDIQLPQSNLNSINSNLALFDR
jgi:hypothetical protein